MDFLSSFRPEGPSAPTVFLDPVEPEDTSLVRDTLTRFLFLSVDNTAWKFFQVHGVIVRFIVTTFTITFLHSENGIQMHDYINVFIDMFFLIDFISALIYRCRWPKKNRAPELLRSQLGRLVWRNDLYGPRSVWMLTLDVLSVLPFEIVRIWVPFKSPVHVIAHCAPLLRGYKFFVFYVENIRNIFLRSRVIAQLVVKFSILWILIGHIFTTFYYSYMVYTKSPLLKIAPTVISFDKHSATSWYIILFYSNQFALGNIGFGDLPPASDGERLITTAMCIVGFGLLNGYLISALSNALAESIRRVATLRLRISLMKTELTNRKVPEEVIKKFEKFYHSLWILRKGVGCSNEIFVSLPNSLCSRIFCDIFLPALNSSILFRHVDPFSKRAIARVMEINLFMAGDVILKRSEITSKMFYIRKGTVEIMSYQDDETQIVTFGAGSVFGQIALLLSLPARSEIHAATFCEIHILNRRNLFLVLNDYPKAKEVIFAVHRNLLWNVLADKFKQSQSPDVPPENVLGTNVFYKVPIGASKIARNDICLVNTCPFVFEPDTVYMKVWSVILALFILVIGFYYPYCATFDRSYPKNVEPFVIIADIVLYLNLYLTFSTAFTKENVLFSSLRVIMATRLRKFSTYVDVIALFPIHYFIDNSSRAKPVVLCLRCLKLYKIYSLFNKAESSVAMKMIAWLRLIKYIIYFFFIDYIVGNIYYLEACFNDPCNANSWYLKNNASANSNSPTWSSLYIAILITSGTGYGDITPKDMTDVVCVIVFCICGAFLFIYLVSEYSAYLSLNAEPKRNFIDLAGKVTEFLVTHKMLPSERIRVRQFLNLQWERNQGYEISENRDLFYDTPLHLLHEISQYTKSKSFHKIQIFNDVSEDIIHAILAKSYRKVLPPHEVVIYAGEVCSSLILIEEGFCELSYGTDASLKKIVGAGYDICTVELMLGINSLCNVRTLTHCTILKIRRHHLLGGLKSNYIAYEELQKSINEFKKTQIVKDVQEIKPIRLHLIVRPSIRKSLFRFRFYRKHGGSSQFKLPYLKLGLCHWIRFVLWRVTLLPYGKLLKVWELLRCLFAFWSAIIFPLIPYLQLQVPALYYIGIALDITAWIDIYVRIHVCYYNEINVLVSHPLRTFSHYLKGSFFLDFFFCFPFDRIMYQRVYDFEGFSLVTTTPISIFRSFRVGQVYRIPATIIRLGVDFLSTPGLITVLCMMVALTIVFLNTMTSGLLLYCINYKVNRNNDYYIVIPERFQEHFDKLKHDYHLSTEPITMYFVNFYWVTETALSIGYGDITADTKDLMIFVIVLIILSYLYLNYVTILIASYLTSINMNLTLYQKRLRHLIKFLKVENVEPLLRKHIVNHFEYVWDQQKGMKAPAVIKNFNVALKNDVLLYLYEDTLKNVGAFLKADQNVFRILTTQVNERNFRSGAGIYKAGDIISEIFIVKQGEVTLVGENEAETHVLSPSMIFGHLEPVPRGIAVLSAVATKNVAILSIKTWQLYILLGNAQGWNEKNREEETEKLKQSLLRSNGATPVGTKKITTSAVEQKTLFYYWMFKFSKYIMIFYVVLSFFSMNEVSFNAAFQEYSAGFVIILVPIEILFIIKIVLGFSTGFLDEAGDFVSDRKRIRRRYMRPTGFYLDLFTVIPFEVFALAFKEEDHAYAASLFRLTKLLRALNIRYFFNLKIDTLSINVVYVKMVNVAVWTSTLLHQSTCFWFFISCHRKNCPDSITWKIILNGNYSSTYINSLYFIVVVLTTTGFGDVSPHTITEFVCVDAFCFIGFFYTAVFIGQIISTVQKSLLDKTNYEYAVSALKTHMYVNDVSSETQIAVLRYIGNMWRNEKGQQVPELLKNAPPYLTNEIKQTTYGHHIINNPVFGACNPFFRKCVMNELQRTVFFPGDIVVYEGEVNRTMYFVHVGLVESSDMQEKYPKKMYGKNTFFGLSCTYGFLLLGILREIWSFTNADLTLLALNNDIPPFGALAKNTDDDISSRLRWRLIILITRGMCLKYLWKMKKWFVFDATQVKKYHYGSKKLPRFSFIILTDTDLGTYQCKRQGVLEREPYTMTYTARTLCNILSLELKHWDYLCEFYPEDVKHIYDEAKGDQWY